MTVYLLHFHDKISNKHTTQHYVGYAKNLSNRIHCHETNPDARLLQVAQEREITFAVARTWKGGRELKTAHKS